MRSILVGHIFVHSKYLNFPVTQLFCMDFPFSMALAMRFWCFVAFGVFATCLVLVSFGMSLCPRLYVPFLYLSTNSIDLMQSLLSIGISDS